MLFDVPTKGGLGKGCEGFAVFVEGAEDVGRGEGGEFGGEGRFATGGGELGFLDPA